MPLDEFWHGDMRLLEAYQKAYLRDVSFNAWYQGQYNLSAFGVIMANAFAKKGQKPAEYPKWKDPIHKELYRPKITKENIEKEFRKQQADQSDWLFKR